MGGMISKETDEKKITDVRLTNEWYQLAILQSTQSEILAIDLCAIAKYYRMSSLKLDDYR